MNDNRKVALSCCLAFLILVLGGVVNDLVGAVVVGAVMTAGCLYTRRFFTP